MRLVQVAKSLGMTGQQLRKELEQVDFGVKPTDREIPDSLAQGIVRYFAKQKGIDIDIEALFGSLVSEETRAEPSVSEVPQESEQEEKEERKTAGVNVLRKLTLEDVSEEAIKKQEESLKPAKKKKKKPAGTPRLKKGSRHYASAAN